MANFDTYGSAYTGSVRTCPNQTTFDFRSQVWMQGTMLMAKGISLTADQGSAGCISSFYTELRHFGTADLFVAGWRTPRASRKWLVLGWPMVWGMLKKRQEKLKKELNSASYKLYYVNYKMGLNLVWLLCPILRTVFPPCFASVDSLL